MKALAIVGITLVGAVLGWIFGAYWGDRHSQYLDFGMPVLLGGLIGTIVGGLAGVVIGAVLFA